MSEKLSDLNLVFSTPIWASLIKDYENLNEKLYDYIKKNKMTIQMVLRNQILKDGIRQISI